MLHKYPELSGEEESTSASITNYLTRFNPDKLLNNLGGNGIAAVYSGQKPGPGIVLRCEMDALPMSEIMDVPYRSVNEGVSHKCGHDGHMAILLGVAAELHNNPPARGSVILLFQPSEEIGTGAIRILRDSRFIDLKPGFVFALHNLPGFPKGSIILKNGVFTSASRGIEIKLKGIASHASEPHMGKNPALAVAQIIKFLTDLSQSPASGDGDEMVTVIHARLGERAFGTSPATACILATLRTRGIDTMSKLSTRIVETTEAVAEADQLECSINWTDEFPITMNSIEAVSFVQTASRSLGLDVIELENTFPWSEDFGHLTAIYTGALFGIGAGINSPPLHSSQYDFPDELISTGTSIFLEIINELLN